MTTRMRPDEVIVEGIMTTVAEGSSDQPLAARWNIAPMGPIVDLDFSRFILRLFKTSITYRNMARSGHGVFHVTDDALMIARSAMGQEIHPPEGAWRRADHVDGVVLMGACRYYELEVETLDDQDERATLQARVVGEGSLRDFLGFNRARHAVVEAAILATRVMLTGPEPILEQLSHFDRIVAKTGADPERQAMAELRHHVEQFGRGRAAVRP